MLSNVCVFVCVWPDTLMWKDVIKCVSVTLLMWCRFLVQTCTCTRNQKTNVWERKKRWRDRVLSGRQRKRSDKQYCKLLQKERIDVYHILTRTHAHKPRQSPLSQDHMGWQDTSSHFHLCSCTCSHSLLFSLQQSECCPTSNISVPTKVKVSHGSF